ncbi:MAG: VCBS repeat-containing protein, partial [Cyclobacteriaceae bacterium]
MNYRTFKIWIAFYIFFFGHFSCVDHKKTPDTLFKKVPNAHSNINFENSLHQNEDFNIVEYLYFYNGGGVAIGDINNDGLPDIYFSANQETNRLYLNKGNFTFADITLQAGVGGYGNWKTGVTMADVNGDGYLDIFSCGVGNYKKFNGRNQLLINNKDLTFTDRTKEYGLFFQGFSTQASFFDYDNDGDLDMYLLNHSVHSIAAYGQSTLRFQSHPLAGDKLYRNDLIPFGTHRFTEVTAQAGIFSSQIGYGLGVGISDLDLDGYLDIYVSNDFRENDYLYINQRNGTFKQVLEKAMPHTSRFSMGNDIGDINNDGWNDIVTLDMLPKEEAIIKTTAGDDPYDIFQYKLRFGYHPQLSRNTMQLNRGLSPAGGVIFSDIAPFSGIEATDWSWSPLLADFDNDGYKDLFIANGIVKRPNDLDYINFISSDSAEKSNDAQFIDRMPSGSVPNVFFRNQHNLTFSNVTEEWLGIENSLSNGAAYADMDNDGDLDIVTNNINESAFIFRNDLPAEGSKYLNIRLHGSAANRFGVGAKITVYAESKTMYTEQIPSRGWQSSVDYLIHVGIGDVQIVDSVSIVWPGQKVQVLKAVKINQVLHVNETDAVTSFEIRHVNNGSWIFQLKNDSLFTHYENDFVSFNVEKLIPHMLTTQGPKLSVGDINGDKLDDFFIGGASDQAGAIFLQTPSGTFLKSIQPSLGSDAPREDMGSAFFDADGNGTLDLLVAGGGQQFSDRDEKLLPALYLNDGKGRFTKTYSSLPQVFLDGSCVKPADIDGDGDLDVFIGGRVLAGRYGLNPRSYLLINNGKGIFSDQSQQWLSGSGALGMVTDAIWMDINKDQKLDLIVVGDWMPITILIQNEEDKLENKTKEYNLHNTNGWWNTIVSHDFDHDGDVDLMAGNLGLNSRLRASVEEPVNIFLHDIDNNGSLDHILTYYNQGKEHPFLSRDQLVKQVPFLRRKFLKYESFRHVQRKDILPGDPSQYLRKTARNFASIYLENTNNGKFSIHKLPVEAQLFPIFSFEVDDVNQDGHADVLAIGN